jgi:hypothetical protein
LILASCDACFLALSASRVKNYRQRLDDDE